MKIKVLFFGATADAAGTRDVEIDADPGTGVSEVFAGLLTAYPNLKEHKLLLAVNQEYAGGGETLSDGDELAIFTPVSGG